MKKKPKHIISAAILFATQKHDGQFDFHGDPYILHPLKVMHTLRTNDEELKAIAVLHDVVEDCFTDAEQGYTALREIGMTERVIEAVRILTKDPNESYDDYIDAVLSNEDATKVKLQDLKHNMDLRRLKGVREKDLERMNKYIRTYHRLAAEL